MGWISIAAVIALVVFAIAFITAALILQQRITYHTPPQQGAMGTKGAAGQTGFKGNGGPLGPTGATGATGAITVTGPNGIPGPDGPTGPWPSNTFLPYVTTNTTQALDRFSGALVVPNGGIGIAGDVMVAGIANIGSIICTGSMQVAGNFYSLAMQTAASRLPSTDPFSGALVVSGGVDVGLSVTSQDVIRASTVVAPTGGFVAGVNIPQFHSRALSTNFNCPTAQQTNVGFDTATQVIGSGITWDGTSNSFTLVTPGRYYVAYSLTTVTLEVQHETSFTFVLANPSSIIRGMQGWNFTLGNPGDDLVLNNFTTIYTTVPNETLSIVVNNASGVPIVLTGDVNKTHVAIQYESRNETAY